MFAGYSKTSFSDNTASNELRDVRFGLYGGYSKGRSEGLVNCAVALPTWA